MLTMPYTFSFVSGGIADTVAKWVFKQDLSFNILELARKKDKESSEEPVENDSTVSLGESEAETGLETILSKNMTLCFQTSDSSEVAKVIEL